MKEHCSTAWLALWAAVFVLDLAFGWQGLLL